MPHSFNLQLHHCVFSTKERRNLITPELAKRLYPYLGGIARENKMKLLAVGGVPDHIHLLLSLPSTLSVSKSLQLLKGISSKWIHDSFPEHKSFEWQKGYGAFTIGAKDVEKTRAYIESQAEHHKKQDFKTEFILFLKKNGIEYDDRYIFD